MLNPVVFAYSFSENKKPDKKLVQNTGRALLFYGLKELGISKEYKILLAPNGKPYFQGNPVFFNISHSFNKMVVAIFSDPIGIDIEVIRENKEKLAKRFFHKSEWEYLSEVSLKDFSKEFTGIWTKKESYIKMTGEGLSKPLDSFNVLEDSPSFSFREVDVFKGYKCHLCTEYPVKEDLYIVESLEEPND